MPVVDYQLCNGCGTCVEVCPLVFLMKDEKAWVKDYDSVSLPDCEKLLHLCPVNAISLEEV